MFKTVPRVVLKIGPRLFPSFPYFYSVLGMFNITVSIGAKIAFLQNRQDVENEHWHFCFCLFYVGEGQTDKEENTQTGKLQKKIAQNRCVGGCHEMRGK